MSSSFPFLFPLCWYLQFNLISRSMLNLLHLCFVLEFSQLKNDNDNLTKFLSCLHAIRAKFRPSCLHNSERCQGTYSLHYGSDISLRYLYSSVLHNCLSECSGLINTWILNGHFSSYSDQRACVREKENMQLTLPKSGMLPEQRLHSKCHFLHAYLFKFLKCLYFDSTYRSNSNSSLKLLL